MNAVSGDVVVVRERIRRLGDPLNALGPDAVKAVSDFVLLLGALNIMSYPDSGSRTLSPTSTRRSWDPETEDRVLLDFKPHHATRLLDYQLVELASTIRFLETYVERPRWMPTIDTNRVRRCPYCHLGDLRRNWNRCPRCGYRLSATAGHAPKCWRRDCTFRGRVQLSGAGYCSGCGRFLKPTEKTVNSEASCPR